MATLVTRVAREHPVLRKVLDDEPEIAGAHLMLGLPAVLDRVRPVVVPPLTAGTAAGQLADRDPEILLDWLVRLVTSVVLVPPPGEVESYFDDVLRRVRTPARA